MALMRHARGPPRDARLPPLPLRAAGRGLLARRAPDPVGPVQLHRARSPPRGTSRPASGGSGTDSAAAAAARLRPAALAGLRGARRSSRGSARSGSRPSTTRSPRAPTSRGRATSPRSTRCARPHSAPSCTPVRASCSWCATSATWSPRSSTSTAAAASRGSAAPARRSDAAVGREPGRLGDGARARLASARSAGRPSGPLRGSGPSPAETLGALLEYLEADSSPPRVAGDGARPRDRDARARRPPHAQRDGVDRALADRPSRTSCRQPAAVLSARPCACSATSGSRPLPPYGTPSPGARQRRSARKRRGALAPGRAARLVQLRRLSLRR